jgi:hypothetical protein
MDSLVGIHFLGDPTGATDSSKRLPLAVSLALVLQCIRDIGNEQTPESQVDRISHEEISNTDTATGDSSS